MDGGGNIHVCVDLDLHLHPSRCISFVYHLTWAHNWIDGTCMM